MPAYELRNNELDKQAISMIDGIKGYFENQRPQDVKIVVKLDVDEKDFNADRANWISGGQQQIQFTIPEISEKKNLADHLKTRGVKYQLNKDTFSIDRTEWGNFNQKIILNVDEQKPQSPRMR